MNANHISRRRIVAGLSGATALAFGIGGRSNRALALRSGVRPQQIIDLDAGRLRSRAIAQQSTPAASPIAQPDMTGAVYTFEVGDLTCHAVSDGATIDPGFMDLVFAKTPPERAEEIVEGMGWDTLLPENHHTSIVIESGDQLVLVDTGFGPGVSPSEGLLLSNLEAAGFALEDFDVLILTHGHPDHIGGNLDIDGNPNFPNARYVLSQEDWEFWSDRPRVEEAMSYAPDFAQLLLSYVDRQLLPLEGTIDLIGYDEEIVPGVTSIAAQGHTPGHMALLVQSGDEKLWIAGDTGLGEMHLRYPDAIMLPDVNPEQVVETRQRLFTRFAEEGSLVTFSHAEPFPSMGRVSSDGDVWAWDEVST